MEEASAIDGRVKGVGGIGGRMEEVGIIGRKIIQTRGVGGTM